MAAAAWDTLWTNARIATLRDGRYSVVGAGALAARSGRIAWLGESADLPGAPCSLARDVRDLGGRWVTPGLIDCHTHLVYAGNRAREFELRLQGASYAEIARAGGGIVSTVTATREATEADLARESARRLQRLLDEGVTTVEIKSGYGLRTDAELKQLRVARRLGATAPATVRTTFLGAHAVPPEYMGRADEYVACVCDEMLPAVAEAGLADAVDAFCEGLAFSPDQTARVFERATALGLPVKLHADQLSDLGGAALAARFRALSADHLEYTNEAGARALADAGTVAVLLPGAFYFLRETRLPPVQALRDHGVPIAVSTDCNPGSAPMTSILLVLNMACTLFRLTPEEALAGVTCHAARALGMADTHGTLEVGKACDFAVWDVEEPAELAYAIGANPCTGVVRGGVPRAP
ncbi:MAG TPA: imidazolonepropionase [Burkholderiales bacterium]|nr:imidazolonepropionase [Burkholderiales bacterium]